MMSDKFKAGDSVEFVGPNGRYSCVTIDKIYKVVDAVNWQGHDYIIIKDDLGYKFYYLADFGFKKIEDMYFAKKKLMR